MGAVTVKVTVEINGKRLVLTEDQFEDVSLSIPSDVHHFPDGTKELGYAHVVLVGVLKQGVNALWEEIDG